MTRRTKRDVARRVDELAADAEDADELPEASDFRIINAALNDAFESVDGEAGLVRCYGDLYRTTPETWVKLRAMLSD